MIGEAHWRGGQFSHELAAGIVIPRQNQVEDVTADVGWCSDVLCETVLSKDVGGTVSGDWAWDVEVADDHELAVKQSQLVEQVWQLRKAQRRDFSWRAVHADDDYGLVAADDLDTELRSATCHMGSHSVTCLPTQWMCPVWTPARQTSFTYPRGMEGWVDLNWSHVLFSTCI